MDAARIDHLLVILCVLAACVLLVSMLRAKGASSSCDPQRTPSRDEANVSLGKSFARGLEAAQQKKQRKQR